MFVNKTVFILGAGASWHYGYPTGEELVDEIRARAKQLASILRHLKTGATYQPPELIKPRSPIAEPGTAAIRPWNEGIELCEKAIQRLRDAQPLVIDYFLGHNEDIELLGRFLIAWAVLEQEYTPSDRTKWHRFVIAQLINGCSESADLLANRVHFVTFNYDTSIDIALRDGLLAHSGFHHADVEEFLRDRVIHLYGCISEPYGERPKTDFGVLKALRTDRCAEIVSLLDRILHASEGIRVIDPKDKDNQDAFSAASNLIFASNVVYILGYGFDENNSTRLRLTEALRQPAVPKSVLFTNFHDANRINKKASRLLFGHTQHFHPTGAPFVRGANGWYYEKSIRDVYGALSLDFDSIEEQSG